MTNEDYVTYETAQALKKAGFDWKCTMAYHHDMYSKHNLETMGYALTVQELNEFTEVFAAPTLAQAQKWLRETKGIAINVIAHDGGKYHWSEVYLPNFKEKGYQWFDYREHPLFNTYESALSAGIEAALKLLTDKTNEI